MTDQRSGTALSSPAVEALRREIETCERNIDFYQRQLVKQHHERDRAQRYVDESNEQLNANVAKRVELEDAIRLIEGGVRV